MSDYTFDLNYRVDAGEVIEGQSVALSPVPSWRSKTGSDNFGNITVGKGDTATIVYGCDTEDWHIAELQLKSQNRSHWGMQPDRQRLEGDAAAGFPGVEAGSGTVLSAGGLLSATYVNRKYSTVDYRVTASNGSGTIWSDPRVKNNGE